MKKENDSGVDLARFLFGLCVGYLRTRGEFTESELIEAMKAAAVESDFASKATERELIEHAANIVRDLRPA